MNNTNEIENLDNISQLSTDIKNLLEKSKKILLSEISDIFQDISNPCPRLKSAIEYSIINQGKCIRSALVYYTGQIFNADADLLKKAMVAVELIHTYSLIHDDLPAMDNSDLRRGMPTNHIKFDEATAILVGDALLSLAFEQLSNSDIDSKAQLKMINLLAKNSGINGMIGGQSLDINNTIKNKAQLDNLHSLKTGALIKASILLGAYANYQAPPNEQQIKSLENYGHAIGLAFQIIDDVLDIEQTTEMLGKPQNLDKTKEIPTYPEIMGSTTKAKNEANILTNKAINELKSLSNNLNISKNHIIPLQLIALYIYHRNN